MLVYTMSIEELHKEVRNDLLWLTERLKGLSIKYAKQLKNYQKIVGIKKVGVSKYKTPRGNTAQIHFWVDSKGPMALFVYKITDGAHTKVLICDKSANISEVTSHFIDRWVERNKENNTLDCLIEEILDLGMGIKKGLVKERDEKIFSIRDGICFCRSDRRDHMTLVTFVSNEMLKESQKKEVEKMKSVA